MSSNQFNLGENDGRSSLMLECECFLLFYKTIVLNCFVFYQIIALNFLKIQI